MRFLIDRARGLPDKWAVGIWKGDTVQLSNLNETQKINFYLGKDCDYTRAVCPQRVARVFGDTKSEAQSLARELVRSIKEGA